MKLWTDILENIDNTPVNRNIERTNNCMASMEVSELNLSNASMVWKINIVGVMIK